MNPTRPSASPSQDHPLKLETYVKRILNASVYGAARETPLEEAPNLSARIDARVLIKREDLQPVFSFKIRGAYNRMAHLSAEERRRGVICASAGNHAQGTAYSARLLQIHATIVMPTTTPEIKVNAVRNHGGSFVEVVLFGDAFDEAAAYSRELMTSHGLTYIHPYDDPLTIAGQGTIAREILHQCDSAIEAVFVPVGGGGLIAGMAAYIKYLRPEIRVIGVEFEESASLAAALQADARVVLPQVGIFADGVAVAQVGEHPWEIARRCVDEVVTVSSDEICGAVKDMFDDTRSVAEPAGALALAGVKKYARRAAAAQAPHAATQAPHASPDSDAPPARTFIAVASGANMNFDRLRYVAEQAEVGEQREALFAVTIPERPGSFLGFCHLLGQRAITEFNYRLDDQHEAHIFVGMQVADTREKATILELLHSAEYPALDITDNSIATSHIRHMVGGRSQHAADEILYSFVFPERPGALVKFLSSLGTRWNISLFHYRNHGAAYGRVLCGFEVPESERSDFRAQLESLGYTYQNETSNPVYRIFL